MRAVAAGVTDVGRERDHNEDRFILVPECGLFVVADGMGGHQCGEVASRMATSTIAGFFRERDGAETGKGAAGRALEDAIQRANHLIHERATTSTTHRGMGTTVVAAAFDAEDRKLYVGHAGDSRCYRLRDQQLIQVTRDHSLIEDALRSRPDMSAEDLAFLPSNVITRALGVDAKLVLDMSAEQARIGDVFLLCSDGLHGFVSDQRICDILLEQPVLTEACADLIAEANANGGGDNITAVVIRIEPAGEPWAEPTSVPPPPRSTRD